MLTRKYFSGGVHPRGNKNTQYINTVLLNQFKSVTIPMLMHLGTPCTCVVSPGESVKVGQLIGRADAPMTVPIHASVSGIVTAVRKEVASVGSPMEVVVIESDGLFTPHESVRPPVVTSREEFVQAIRDAGLVGLGGAAFPTYIKMKPPPGKEPDTLLINAAECEPYITADSRLCAEHPDEIIDGIELVMKHMNIPRTLIGVEKNKPLAIAALNHELEKRCAAGSSLAGISVVALKTIYPQGAEKMLAYSLTRRKIPSGGLPHDIRVCVLNVGTARYIGIYLKTGMPLVRKLLTLDGSALRVPGNFDVPVGASIADVIEAAGGLIAEPGKVIMGGPMMGVAVDRLTAGIIKNNNAILVFDRKDGATPAETQCIRCARCIEVCPMNLIPTQLDVLARNKDVGQLSAYHVNDCIECGCCSFACPAKRYLVQSIRNGKAYVRQARQKEAAVK